MSKTFPPSCSRSLRKSFADTGVSFKNLQVPCPRMRMAAQDSVAQHVDSCMQGVHTLLLDFVSTKRAMITPLWG